MKYLSLVRLAVLSFLLFLTACGGGGGDSAPAAVQPQPDPASWLQGYAVNSPISGAEIQLFRFDADGNEIEIVAGSAPVITNADGEYKFWITGGSIDADTGPLLIRSSGGSMNSAAAPTLEAVVANSLPLQADGTTLTQHISVASSVAAQMLRLKTSGAGAAPSVSDASAAITLVEQELAVSLSQDPSDPTQPISVFAHSVDQNLALEMSPDNAPAVNDFIEYLALNMSSASGALDNTMLDLATGTSVASSFDGVGSGLLASLVTDGPASFKTVHLVLDKTEIENDGMDTAFLNVSVSDANGDPVVDGTVVHFETTLGRLVISKNQARTAGGATRVNLSSVWAGEAEVSVGYNGSNGAIQSAQVGLTVVNETADVEDTVQPKVSSAGSTSNTQILVSFSEAMRGGMDSAENPLHFRISGIDPLLSQKTGQAATGKSGPAEQVNQKPEVRVIAAELILPDRKTVRLTTLSQSDLRYEVQVVNMSDINGNAMSAGEQFETEPTRAEFQGIAPSGAEIVDSDGDGLSDSDEQRGWIVSTVTAAGVVLTFEVTSDPLNADTDGDLVPDNEEFHGGFNPRSADSDGDTLTDNMEWNVIYSDPTNQDTDGDGTQDGFELYSFRTSPVLADTDGDQISDTDEVLGRSRDPRISDIPRAGISVGEVRLQIDERFTYEDVQGSTVTVESASSSTLSQSENTSFSTSNTDVTEHVAAGRFEAGMEGGGGRGTTYLNGAFFNIEGSYQYTSSNSFTTDRTSAVESQRAHEQSLRKAQEFNTTSTVTREIVGARIDVDLTINNTGDLAYSISNLEITVLQRDHQSTNRFVPVATLIANSALITGQPAVFNLGPFTPERGPILFSSRDVFPNLVEQLMKSPSGLIFKVANFDMTDEFGRIFTFANQIARDRTAGIIVDNGDGRPQQYLVATALQPDPDGFGRSAPGEEFPHVGGFFSDGSPVGIPLDFALQDTLELKKNTLLNDGIVAGPNRQAESIAQGDDVQLIPPLTTGVGVGSIVISAGLNGVLDTIPLGDDEPEVTTGYETSLTCDAISANAREVCSADSDCTGGGTCSGPEILVRFNGYRNGDLDRTWVVMTNRQIPAGADFGQVVLKPGADIFLAFVQDLDEDGLFAREEYMSGSTDSKADNFDNGLFGENFDENLGVSQLPDGIPDSKDTDRDGLGDFSEVRVGWKVAVDGGIQRQVFSSPRLRDSDGDRLLDPVERDLRRFCTADDPRGGDGLCSFQSKPPVDISDAVAIIAGPNMIADSIAQAGDEQLVDQGIGGLRFDTPIVGVGGVAGIQSTLLGDDLYESLTNIPPASDPSLGDTDADSVSDFLELDGFDIGLSIRDGGNGVADTQANGDDIQKSFFSNPVKPLGIVILPGSNGTIDTVPGGDDRVSLAEKVVTDPLRRDTDTDLVADGRELSQGGNPTDPYDGEDFRDSDQDGLTDSEEADLGWMVSVNGLPGVLVNSNPSLPDSDLDGLPDLIERDIRTNPNKADTDGDGLSDFDEFADFERFSGLDQLHPRFFVDGASSKQYGTKAIQSDSDGDTLSDSDELLKGYRVLLAGEQAFRQIFTNPMVRDTDFDGREDQFEKIRNPPTDATDPDTDDDGRSDGVEFSTGTDPLVPDISVTVRYVSLTNKSGSAGPNPFWAQWSFNLSRSTSSFPGRSMSNQNDFSWRLPGTFGGFGYYDDGDGCTFYWMGNLGTLNLSSGRSETFSLRPGQGFTLNGSFKALDSCPSTVHCKLDYLKTFTFEDLSQGGYRVETESLTGQTCSADLTYEIITN